jgi:hypothetical protein
MVTVTGGNAANAKTAICTSHDPAKPIVTMTNAQTRRPDVADDIVDRLRCTYVAEGCGQCTFCLARNEIELLQEEINDLRLQVVILSIPKETGDD